MTHELGLSSTFWMRIIVMMVANPMMMPKTTVFIRLVPPLVEGA